MSATDLEAAQQYSLHRLYPLSSRKLYPSAAAAAANGVGLVSGGSLAAGAVTGAASAVNIKFATINHHHGSAGSMSHSHSTGDVASIFGRA